MYIMCRELELMNKILCPMEHVQSTELYFLGRSILFEYAKMHFCWEDPKSWNKKSYFNSFKPKQHLKHLKDKRARKETIWLKYNVLVNKTEKYPNANIFR